MDILRDNATRIIIGEMMSLRCTARRQNWPLKLVLYSSNGGAGMV